MAISLNKHHESQAQLLRAKTALGILKTHIGCNATEPTFLNIQESLRILAAHIAAIPRTDQAENTDVGVGGLQQTLKNIDEKLARAEAAVYGSFVFNPVEELDLGPLESDLIPVEWEAAGDLNVRPAFVEASFLEDPYDPYWNRVQVQAG